MIEYRRPIAHCHRSYQKFAVKGYQPTDRFQVAQADDAQPVEVVVFGHTHSDHSLGALDQDAVNLLSPKTFASYRWLQAARRIA